jgi:hypothetical protein
LAIRKDLLKRYFPNTGNKGQQNINTENLTRCKKQMTDKEIIKRFGLRRRKTSK